MTPTRDEIVGTIAACLAQGVLQEVVELVLLQAGFNECEVESLMDEPLEVIAVGE